MRLASYNEYRQLMGLRRAERFDQISRDKRTQYELRACYSSVDHVEFVVGLFAEDMEGNWALPPLLGRMTASDLLTQALSHPLLAANVFTELTFSRPGVEMIANTTGLSDILHRNIPFGQSHHLVSLTRPDWLPT